jgi:hypothetical protein
MRGLSIRLPGGSTCRLQSSGLLPRGGGHRPVIPDTFSVLVISR